MVYTQIKQQFRSIGGSNTSQVFFSRELLSSHLFLLSVFQTSVLILPSLRKWMICYIFQRRKVLQNEIHIHGGTEAGPSFLASLHHKKI